MILWTDSRKSGAWGDWVLLCSQSGTGYTDSSTITGYDHQYRAKSVNTDVTPNLKSSYSNREMIGLERPAAPVIMVTASTGKNMVKWSAVAGARTYIVYWRNKASGDWSDWSTTEIQTTSYNHKNVTNGVEYQYRVRANNGLMSEYSNRIAVKAQ